MEFEQKRQDTRLLTFDAKLTLEILEKEYLRLMALDNTPQVREKAAEMWNKAKELRDIVDRIEKELSSGPATSDTGTRLWLEKLHTDQRANNMQLHYILDTLKKSRG